MTFYIALTNENDTVWTATHKRLDEDLVKFTLTHSEGDFAYVEATIKNPRRPWLTPEMNVWVWLAKDDTPFFFGRLDAVPEDVSGELVQMRFVARSNDYETQKSALANSKKVAPFWDAAWINEDQVNNPDVVFEARSELIHVDRMSLAVTASDIINGEDGTIVIDQHIYDSLMMSRGSAPVRRVRIEAEVSWTQTASGTVDITPQLKEAFALAGSTVKDANGQDVPSGRVSSFTGQGLLEDHPEEFDDLKGGWSIGETSLVRVDGTAVDARYKDVTIKPTAGDVSGVSPLNQATATTSAPYKARFYLWEFVPSMQLNYYAERQRIEYLTVEVSADMQAISRDDAELLVLPLQSQRVSEPVDPGNVMPIRSLHNNAYFLSDRGKQSVEYFMMLCRAKLLSNARAVEVSAAYTFDFGLQYSCRKNAVIVDPRLPNGQAAGKIIRYTLVADNSGSEYSTLTIGCAVGRGNSVEAAAGETEYGEEDWDENYQERVDAWVLPPVGDIIYKDYNSVDIVDDGANFDAFDVTPFIKQFEVINGETVQRGVLSQKFQDIPEAVEALNAVFTEVFFELEPIDKVGPFETTYGVTTSALQVPRMIDLEGA